MSLFDDLSDDELIARLVQRGVPAASALVLVEYKSHPVVEHYRDGCEVCVEYVDELLS